jgi:hypothetical protein
MGTSLGITGVVAASWLIALVFSGSLTLTNPTANAGNSTLAQNSDNGQTTGGPGVVANTASGFNQLLGAAGVAVATTAPASLTIVDVTPTSTPAAPKRNSEGQEVIPF